MTSVDVRTRADVTAALNTPEDFVAALKPAPTHGGQACAAAITRMTLPPLTIRVHGRTVCLRAEYGVLTVSDSPATSGLVVAMDDRAFTDLVTDSASTFGLHMMGRVHLQRGDASDFIAWEPLLRFLIDARPVYTPGAVVFADRHGSPMSAKQSFTLDDDHDDIGHFLAQAGYLHLRGVFTAAEMFSLREDLNHCIRQADRDDGESWWARTDAGEWYPSRILQFNRKSAAMRELLTGERYAAIGTLTDDAFVLGDLDADNAAEGLLKKPGVVEGISDVSWHKDCSMGGHSRRCSSLVVGISLTESGDDTGELSVVAGSHRANIIPLGADGLDLPQVALPTQVGDVTVHCSCTLHMSSPPQRGHRQVVYAGFSLAPRTADQPVRRSSEDLLDERASYNDRVRWQQTHGQPVTRTPR